MRFAIVAGEASGDILGAALVRALRARFPQAAFCGVTGPRMQEAGCASLASIEQLSVMGLAEVLPKLASILRLRRELYRRLRAQPPDCFIGVDAPDFNLVLERRLRKRGVPTAHLVSPTVWAWRGGRVRSIARSTGLLLCLFPFEPAFYSTSAAAAGLRAVYIGHPLAEELAQAPGREAARRQLGLGGGACVAVLPGSRAAELRYLAQPFAGAAAWLAQRRPQLSFVVPIAKPSLRPLFQRAIDESAPGLDWRLLDGQSRLAMAAADAVLLASGTATLECLLLARPMVVAYRVSALSAAVVRWLKLIKIARVSLPNLLCDQAVVPEFLQEQARPEALGAALLALLDDPAARARQIDAFAAAAGVLKRDAAAAAAAAIAGLIGR